MATGYTAPIEKGVSFESFVMGCARAFGALITMRDEPSDAPIQRLEPSTYYKESLKRHTQELKELDALTETQCQQQAAEEREEQIKNAKKYVEEYVALRTKYEDMLAKVRAWTPPTPDHAGLKTFMEDQITSSIRHDCDNDYWQKQIDTAKAQVVNGAAWRAERRHQLVYAIGRDAEEWEKEKARTEERNKWVEDLRNSLQEK